MERCNIERNTSPSLEQGDDTSTNLLLAQWKASVFEIMACQASSPWFECRMGRLTGTTTKNLIKCLKFKLLEKFGTDFLRLINFWGIRCQLPDSAKVDKLITAKHKAAYKALGFF